MAKVDLLGKNLNELEEVIHQLGQPAYRARQLMHWIYKGAEFAAMTNLPRALRERLENEYCLATPVPKQVQQAADGTRKYLLALSDGQTIETVYIPEEKRKTVCISTQIGCAMGCAFCATGLSGLARNLTPGEIVGQVLTVQQDTGVRITNVVFMGMGEPLANYDSVRRAIDILNSEDGCNIGMRRITVSTAGLVPEIKRLAEEKLQLVLAISLHAPSDELRNHIMPINKRYPLSELLDACRYYSEGTGRRVTFEYALIKDLNDTAEHAHALSRLLSGLLCHINLIPLNTVPGTAFEKSPPARVQHFFQILSRSGLEVSIRQERGADIEAACGQLRRRGNDQ